LKPFVMNTNMCLKGGHYAALEELSTHYPILYFKNGRLGS
jgi:hypothetical protein